MKVIIHGLFSGVLLVGLVAVIVALAYSPALALCALAGFVGMIAAEKCT